MYSPDRGRETPDRLSPILQGIRRTVPVIHRRVVYRRGRGSPGEGNRAETPIRRFARLRSVDLSRDQREFSAVEVSDFESNSLEF